MIWLCGKSRENVIIMQINVGLNGVCVENFFVYAVVGCKMSCSILWVGDRYENLWLYGNKLFL